MKILLTLLTLVAATGAQAMSRPKATPCGAELYRDLVGQVWQQDMLKDRDGPLRVLKPGSIMTMDFREERLNVELDEADRIANLRCG